MEASKNGNGRFSVDLNLVWKIGGLIVMFSLLYANVQNQGARVTLIGTQITELQKGLNDMKLAQTENLGDLKGDLREMKTRLENMERRAK